MKLTKAQYNIIVKLLDYQLKGYYIAIGNSYSYNANELTAIKIKKNFGSGKRIVRDMNTQALLGNGNDTRTLKRPEVLRYVDPTSDYDEFYKYYVIDFPKLLRYDNGKEAVNEAMDNIINQ